MLDHHSRHIFEDRYGAGALARLIGLLEKPCVSFAAIATEFGVTRERVRQWHQELMPGAPLGHTRRRLCQDYQRKRRLLADALFRRFYVDVRRHLGEGRLTLIRSAEGYRRRRARVDGRIVALGDASAVTASDLVDRSAVARGALDRSAPDAAPHDVPLDMARLLDRTVRVWRDADFVYLRLPADAFLFAPTQVLAADGDRAPYVNSFEALNHKS
jgi:hypothetical protein